MKFLSFSANKSIAIIFAVFILVVGAFLLKGQLKGQCDLEGDIIDEFGVTTEKAAQKSKCDLPECDFNGFSWAETPCFSPKGSVYF